jgi:hypothetical protein
MNTVTALKYLVLKSDLKCEKSQSFVIIIDDILGFFKNEVNFF